MLADLQLFFDQIPKDLVAKDKTGAEVIYCFGFGFDSSNPSTER